MERAFKNLNHFQGQVPVFCHLETSHYPYITKTSQRPNSPLDFQWFVLEVSLAMYLRHTGCTQKAFQVSRSQAEEKNR